MSEGNFVFSFDFELFWGVHHNKDLQSYGKNLEGAILNLPRISHIFADHDVFFTCANVGMLYNNDWKEWERNKPELLPEYKVDNCSPFQKSFFIEKSIDHNYLFSKEIISVIRNCGHEIATHTYSHYFCLDAENGIGAFKSDLEAAINIAKLNNDLISTIIFPRNQYADEHLKICNEFGIKVFRGNPDSGIFNKSNSLFNAYYKKTIRTLDSFLNVTGSNTFSPENDSSGLLDVKASFFFRSSSSTKLTILNYLHLRRLKNAMTEAAIKKETIHIWCHPHNIKTEKDIEGIQTLLHHYVFLNKKYGFKSMRMNDFFAK